jgi:hypothetical protein
MESPNIEDIALRTLILLEWRLKRLEFLVTGDDHPHTENDAKDSTSDDTSSMPITARLQRLESSLQKLSSKSETISTLLRLRTPKSLPSSSAFQLTHAPESRTPSLFSHQPPSSALPPSAPLPHKTTTLLSAAPTLHATASQLRSLADTSFPPTSTFTTLVSLAPRIHALAERQRGQAREVADLRTRTARAAVRWQEVFVVGQGRCWVEWEERVRGLERGIKRGEWRADG